MRFLLRFLVRLILLAMLTFGFVVLFEHGPAKFYEGAKAEWNALLFFVGSVLSREERSPAPPPGRASPTPAAAPVSTRSPAQKAPAADSATNRPATGTPPANR
jgi:hypothetical protein